MLSVRTLCHPPRLHGGIHVISTPYFVPHTNGCASTRRKECNAALIALFTKVYYAHARRYMSFHSLLDFADIHDPYSAIKHNSFFVVCFLGEGGAYHTGKA